MNRKMPVGIVVALLACVLAETASAGRLKTVSHQKPADHEKTTFAAVVLSNQGALRLSKELRPLPGIEATHIWALAEDAAGNLYAATGDEGKVFKVPAEGKPSVLFTSEQSQALALAVDPKGRTVYVGTGPEAHVVRIDAEGAKVVCKLPESYIWAMAFAPDGETLYAATGPAGKIYRLTREGKASVFFDTKQDHVLCLAVGPEGTVYAGTDKTGRVYRINPKGKGFVLHQTEQAEVRTMVLSDKALYIGTAGTKKRAASPTTVSSSKEPSRATTEKKTEATLVSTGDKAEKLATNKPVSRGKASGKGTPAAAPKSPAVGENGAYRISQGGSVAEAYRGKLLVLSLMRSGTKLLAGTGLEGRLIEVDEAEGEHAEIARLDHGQILCQLRRKDGSIVLGAGDPGKLYVLEDRHATKGTATSDVLDAKLASKWGALRWRATTPTGTTASVAVRCGNVAEPDETWSDWSAEQTNGDEARAAVPVARYLQYRVTLTTKDATKTPTFHGLTLRYATSNRAPEVSKIEVPDSVGGKSESPGKLKFKWSATDANEDELRYRLLVKKENWTEWAEIEEDCEKAEFEWDATGMPSGRYRLKVVASDHADNPEMEALTGARVSEPFVVCHEAPKVALKTADSSEGRMTILATASSAWVRLTEASFAVNGKRWTSAFPEDGLFDSKSKTFRFRTEALRPGKYVVVLKVKDAAGNTGTGEAVFAVPGK